MLTSTNIAAAQTAAWIARLAVAILVVLGAARAQDFNLDIGTFNTPSSSYGPWSPAGHWELVPATANALPLSDTTGAATAATITCTPPGANGSLSGNQNLDTVRFLFDFEDLQSAPSTWTVSGLAPGRYRVSLFSWPDPLFAGTARFEVLGGALGPQNCAYLGVGYVTEILSGRTFVQDVVTVTNGTLSWTAQLWSGGYAYLSGVQIEVLPPGVVKNYCSAQENSLGCLPTIFATGTPSIAANNLRVKASDVLNNKSGLLIWSRQPAQLYFYTATSGTGFLCVGAPRIRTPVQDSAGNVGATDCSGTYSFHFNSNYLAQVGLAPGDLVHCQYWARDPTAPSGVSMTDALFFDVVP